MYEVFFKFYSCNEDIKPSAAFSCRHIKYEIHAPECTKTRNFYFKNSKIFSGGGTAPSPDPSPSSRGKSPSAPTHLDLRATSSRSLMHHPPTQKSGYGPADGFLLYHTGYGTLQPYLGCQCYTRIRTRSSSVSDYSS